MDVAVFISGVCDPKWPLPRDLSVQALLDHAARHTVLSPFDEAALELALRLRDADDARRISALVVGSDALARRVAAWRPDALHRVDTHGVSPWDTAALAHRMARATRALASRSGWILMGREFGDFDDGTVPAMLAATLSLAYLPLALRIDEPAGVVCQGAGGLQRVRLGQPALLSVSNDPGNRLRHPLMKNVMLARKAPIDSWAAPGAGPGAPIELRSLKPTVAASRDACRWLEGSGPEKARALAELLRGANQP